MNRQTQDSEPLLNLLAPFLGLILVIALFSAMPDVQSRFLRPANLKASRRSPSSSPSAPWA